MSQIVNELWDDTPVDVTAEANFIWSIANKLRGSYMPDKYGDVIIWDSYDLNYIFYRLGSNLVNKVIKKGKLVIDHEKTC